MGEKLLAFQQDLMTEGTLTYWAPAIEAKQKAAAEAAQKAAEEAALKAAEEAAFNALSPEEQIAIAMGSLVVESPVAYVAPEDRDMYEAFVAA